MKERTLLLRISYWIGAIIDTIHALVLAAPATFSGLYETIFASPPENTPGFIGIARVASMMIFAWTCLLLWADRKPVERKGVLLLTICPIGITIIILKLLPIIKYGLTMESLLGILSFSVMFGFFALSYIANRTPEFRSRNCDY